ncbi:AraC family transcriptional regulator [Paenibacillus allorhizosphaerae]|uniref:HTH-type transcriptional activator RhaR n=1 Tax=Paenibacillus allorhizosphaerae TaxID=2849866 RepID=A0ABM8VJS0_9BACL|nr:AraC family transcriptional regulator [Paenibacillus allorhizosphaerae]CAG7645741.1 HTH-type transcriptional activator RhaR [Paenibacillus allorhizosphaerae]
MPSRKEDWTGQPVRIVENRHISNRPTRIVDLKVDPSRLMLKSLTILNVGHIPERIHYREQAHFQYWAIVYIAEGSGSYRYNDCEPQLVRKGSMFVFSPDGTFHYGPGAGESWDEHYFTIEGTRIQEWLDTGLIEPGKVKQTTGDHHAKITRIGLLMASGIPGHIDQAALLLESLLFDLALSSRLAPQSAEAESKNDLMEDIADCLYRPFEAKALCEKHHISASTLRRSVAKYTGYPLNEYIHRLKIAEAKNILLNTDQSVKEIASALGYGDAFYFSRLFKKFVGVSPNHYRHSL